MPHSEIAAVAATAVPTINSALTLFDRAFKIVKGGANMEAKETMLALREALLAVKEENFELREAYSKLRQEANTRVSMHYEEPVYYFLASDGSRTGPFCQTCFDREGKSSRLQSLADGYWYCSVCKAKPETVAHAKLRSERIAAKRSARRSIGIPVSVY